MSNIATGLYTDRYELTMAATYWRDDRADEPVVFDYFFRKLPFDGGFVVFAGLGPFIEALRSFQFGERELEFLRSDGFEDAFLDYLRSFRFRGSIWAPPEGEVVFPYEPIVRVEGGLIEVQIIETLLLNTLNFQSLIATKAARCVRAADGAVISEFGMRRAQGDGCMAASRAAFIGGCQSTSNMQAAMAYCIPAAGTMAHSFIQSYSDELTAFRKFAEVHGANTVVLLDTYDTLRSGLPNAITLGHELRNRGQKLAAVRLDSGDLAYLSRMVRAGLDEAGLQEVKIVVSNQLDEYLIRSLVEQKAPIDIYGVGTSLATGAPTGALDGVYKLSMIDGHPRLKMSESVAKSTLPGRKKILRYENNAGEFMADAIVLDDEDDVQLMVHPFEPLQQLDLSAWKARPLRQLVVKNGKVSYDLPAAADAADYARERLNRLPPEHHRFEHPHVYKVGLSPRLRTLRDELLEQACKKLQP